MEDKKAYKLREDLRDFLPYFIEILKEIKGEYAVIRVVEREARERWPGLKNFKNSQSDTRSLVSRCFKLCGWTLYATNSRSKTYKRGYLNKAEFEKLEGWAEFKLPQEKLLRNS